MTNIEVRTQNIYENLSNAEKKVAAYFLDNVENVFAKPISQLAGIKLNQGYIGGYTGGRIEDLRLAAQMFKGKHIAWGFRLCVSPVTSEVYLQAMEEGLLEIFIDFGAQIIPPGEHGINRQGAGLSATGRRRSLREATTTRDVLDVRMRKFISLPRPLWLRPR